MEKQIWRDENSTPRFKMLDPLSLIHFQSLLIQDEQANAHYIMRLKLVKTDGLGFDEFFRKEKAFYACTRQTYPDRIRA